MVHGAKCLVLSAMVAVGLTAFAAEPEAVQLWEGGDNVGADGRGNGFPVRPVRDAE